MLHAYARTIKKNRGETREKQKLSAFDFLNEMNDVRHQNTTAMIRYV